MAKDLIRKYSTFILKNNRIVLFLYNSYFKIKNKNKYLRLSEERSALSIYEYEQLAKPLPFYPQESVKDTNYYGHAFVLKKYASISYLPPFSVIEHGLYLGSYVPDHFRYKTIKNIITFSDNRCQHIVDKGINKNVIVVGPYIYYANSLLNEKELAEEKQKLGKVLLVFVAHSTNKENVSFDSNSFLNKIDAVAKEYDTVLICLYYLDILNGTYSNVFVGNKYRIVTAGHVYDYNFISRLKTIILLSDFTMSNSLGTHIGYCITLGKPHYYFCQEKQYYSSSGNKQLSMVRQEDKDVLDKEKKELMDTFSEESSIITEKQLYCVNKYWGASSVKSPEELHDILEKSICKK